MADTKAQNETQRERGIARRQELRPSRDQFSFSPFSMMRRLTEEMDRAFATSFGLPRGFGESGVWSLPVDVRERDGNLEISAELPGMNKEDVRVECADEGIIIEGEKRPSRNRKKAAGIGPSAATSFLSMIPLPDGADAEKAKAEFKDGVLHVRVPISEQKRKTRRFGS